MFLPIINVSKHIRVSQLRSQKLKIIYIRYTNGFESVNSNIQILKITRIIPTLMM